MLPFFYKMTASLQLSALISVELLAFTSLFGAYYYGGVSSPFLPWLIVSLLLGFFYLIRVVPSSLSGCSPSTYSGFAPPTCGGDFRNSFHKQQLCDRRLDIHPVGDDLHVLDGDLLRQHDRNAIRA